MSNEVLRFHSHNSPDLLLPDPLNKRRSKPVEHRQTVSLGVAELNAETTREQVLLQVSRRLSHSRDSRRASSSGSSPARSSAARSTLRRRNDSSFSTASSSATS